MKTFLRELSADELLRSGSGDTGASLDGFVMLAVFRCWGGGTDGTV